MIEDNKDIDFGVKYKNFVGTDQPPRSVFGKLRVFSFVVCDLCERSDEYELQRFKNAFRIFSYGEIEDKPTQYSRIL